MKRPDPKASTESWINIWLACMGVRLTRFHSASDSTFNEIDIEGVDHKVNKKIARSLHQNACGEGYTPRESCRLHPGIKTYQPGGSQLGATPAETAGIRRAQRMKRLYP